MKQGKLLKGFAYSRYSVDWSYKFRNRSIISGFPGGSAVKNPPAMQELQVRPLGWEDPLEEGMELTPVFLPGEPHGQRAVGHTVTKSWTQRK